MKSLKYTAIISFNLFFSLSFAQVGINTTAPKATVEIQTSKKENGIEGVLIPRVTTQRAETMGEEVPESTLVYITDGITGNNTASQIQGKGFYYFDTSTKKWTKIGASTSTSNEVTLYSGDGVLPTNRVVKMNGNNLSFEGNGNVGIGTSTPTEKLEISEGNVKIKDLYSSTATSEETIKPVAVKEDGTLTTAPETPQTILGLFEANTLYTLQISAKNFFPIITHFEHEGGIMGYDFSIRDGIWHLAILPANGLRVGAQKAYVGISFINR
ncbi:hypothetical protein ACT4R9_08475 [Ornithobacterium rhinotracheale]|uniref:hypothetical protein n=1 Tax=Ornithobacterium rhinotracheale TaxID=28251 RepID=UPI003FA47174